MKIKFLLSLVFLSVFLGTRLDIPTLAIDGSLKITVEKKRKLFTI